ncbi:MAG: DUF899 family protein [Chitinophagales bacterium]
MNDTLYKQIDELQQQIEDKRKAIQELRSQLQPEPIKDYALKDKEGRTVMLSALFDERGELLVVHNMGKRCSYCTLWADGFNGFSLPLADRMPFVVISPDAPEVQKEFAESRGWNFYMLSAEGSTFIADLGFEPAPGKYYPGASALILKDGQVYRTGKDLFGPGDDYCSVWHLFDLFPNGANGWHPKIKYANSYPTA